MPGAWETVLLGAAFVATFAGTWAYRSLAIRRGIVAEPNFRSLHEGKVPRGGGIVFSLVCIAIVIGLSRATDLDPNLVRAIVVGGTVAAAFGFFDDAYQIGPWLKLLIQATLAAWTLWSFSGRPLYDLPLTPEPVDLALSWLGLVWLMNLHNFIDGIDGLAASGAVLVSALAIVVLVLTRADAGLVATFGCIAACSAAFLVFNWPPASLFMGDAGSMFLGFCFGALMTATVTNGAIQLWTWLVMFGFFAGDTTTTTVVRMFVTDKWYGEHRSHAYQNLARLSGSHLKVVQGVWLYHLIWLLPLAILAARWPSSAPLAAVLAFGPVVVWTLRYGPRLSSS
jgi:Fuc2NAc and GlcNAc transferase